jgi:hypothetical protein
MEIIGTNYGEGQEQDIQWLTEIHVTKQTQCTHLI